MKISKKYVFYLIALLLIGFTVLAEPLTHQTKLKEEFEAIQHPEATITWSDTFNILYQVKIEKHFRHPLSYNEFRHYYENQLTEHGWSFIREDKGPVWGGEAYVYYQKGNYRLCLNYRGNEKTTYTIKLWWKS